MNRISKIKNKILSILPILFKFLSANMNRIKKIAILFFCLLCCQTAQAEWTRQTTETLAWLRAIHFVNEKNGWIGGSGGTFLSTMDGGKTWRQSHKFTGDTIRKIYFSDENNGWLLCERDLFSLGANSPSYLLKTANGGAKWEKVDFTGAKRERISNIFFTSDNYGIAVGETGAFFVMQDDRKTWKKQPAPVRYLLLDGIFTDNSKGVMVGASGTILFTEDAGFTWDKATLAGDAKAKLHSVFFINSKNGWTVGAQGKIFHTFNGGRFWREQNSGISKDLNDIFFLDTAEGWAVGNDGAILHTTTAGNVWTLVDSKIKHKLERVLFVGKKGWAIGFGGTILTYDEDRSEKKMSIIPQLQQRN